MFVVVAVVLFSQENVIVPWFPDNIYFFLMDPWLIHATLARSHKR